MPIPCPHKTWKSWNCENCGDQMCYRVVEQIFIDKGMPPDIAEIIAKEYKYSGEYIVPDSDDEEDDWMPPKRPQKPKRIVKKLQKGICLIKI